MRDQGFGLETMSITESMGSKKKPRPRRSLTDEFKGNTRRHKPTRARTTPTPARDISPISRRSRPLLLRSQSTGPPAIT